MQPSGTIPRFLDVLSYQVLATRNYLRHFLKGVTHEFLPAELEVQIDWERNTYSLVYLIGPAFHFMESELAGASPRLVEQIQLNMSHLRVLYKDLKDAYATYVAFSESSPSVSRFDEARPWLISNVDKAIFTCDRWIERMDVARQSARVGAESCGESFDEASLALWREVVAFDLPLELTGLDQRIIDMDDVISKFKQTSEEAFSSRSLADNPLLQLCMASRRLQVTAFFLFLTNRPAISIQCVKTCRDAMQRALDATEEIIEVIEEQGGSLSQLTREGIRLLNERHKILDLLSDSVNRIDDNPAAELLLTERKASEERTNDDRLLLGMELNAAA